MFDGTDPHDGLYDSLPEIFDFPPMPLDTPPTLNENIPVSLHSLNEESMPSTENTASAKRCSCCDSVQWAWEENTSSEFVRVMNNNMDVKFHKYHSNGTAVVRCSEPMSNDQYYWEIKMTYPVYGTDIMVGVGTSEAEVKDIRNKFISVLGKDEKSWGLSYSGIFYHNGEHQFYANGFGQGNTIGVHLDLWRGTLSFSKDKKQFGVASSGLRGRTLYAMASSTAARSGMRIIYSCSFPSSLQFFCCQKLRKIIPSDKDVLEVLTFPPGLKTFLQNNLSWLLGKQVPDTEKHICALDSQNDDDDVGATNIIEILEPRTIDMFVDGQYVLLGSLMLRNQNRFLQPSRVHFRQSASIDERRGESAAGCSKRVRRCNLEGPDQFQ